MSGRALSFRIAAAEWEFAQIHELNYRTFVEEIPQHPPNAARSLVDRFHAENTYAICMDGDKLVGMAAVRGRRPFSLDAKLANIDTMLPPCRAACEFRLLAVEPAYRHLRVCRGMVVLLGDCAESQGYDLVVMSGTTRQLKLYQHMGFVAFGPLVGEAEARYQPMYLTQAAFRNLKTTSKAFTPGVAVRKASVPANFLPGPVAISEAVESAFSRAPVSHRSQAFMQMFAQTKSLLCELVGSRSVEIFTGSGTMANDVVAGQLSLLRKPGLVLANGEFGRRLQDHATRFGLAYRTVEAAWGLPFRREQLARAFKDHGDIGWVWAAHCETSSGILNDAAYLQTLAANSDALLCLDCASSLGTVPVDLAGVYLASAVSGKGLGAYPGLSMVFYNHEILQAPQALPRYLDLGLYRDANGVPFTISSNLVCALHAALTHRDPQRFERIVAVAAWLRSKLSGAGLRLIGEAGQTSPGVITIALPPAVRSRSVGDRMQVAGYLLSYNSEYLLQRNWVQVCLMGDYAQETLAPLVDELVRVCAPAAYQVA
jgi:aspartate aminotransferase-like enzyme